LMPGIRTAGNIPGLLLQQQQMDLQRRRQKMDEQDAMIKNIMGMVGLGIGGAKAGTEIYTGLNNLGDSQRLNAARIRGLDTETGLAERRTRAGELSAEADMVRAKRPTDVLLQNMDETALKTTIPVVNTAIAAGNLAPDAAVRVARDRASRPGVESDVEVYMRNMDALLQNPSISSAFKQAYLKKNPSADASGIGYGPDALGALSESPPDFGAAMKGMFGNTSEQDQAALIRELSASLGRGGPDFIGSIANSTKELQDPLPVKADTLPGSSFPSSNPAYWGNPGSLAPSQAKGIEDKNDERASFYHALMRAAKIYGGADPVQLGPEQAPQKPKSQGLFNWMK
jgi:hypothetical protein